MAAWNKLSDDLKACVIIHNELKAGREVWFTKLAELLKDDMTKHDISKLEDRLMDLGILDKQYEKVDGKWTNCYRICSEASNFIENVADNLEAKPKGVCMGCGKEITSPVLSFCAECFKANQEK